MARSALFDNRDWRDTPMGELLAAGQEFLDAGRGKREMGNLVEAHVADANFDAVWKEVVRRCSGNV